VIRVAAAGDLHFGPDAAGTLRPYLDDLAQEADVLLLAGDLTRVGDPAEAAVLIEELSGLRMPIVAVLGNHDYHTDRAAEIAGALFAAGIHVLEGESVALELNGCRLGIAGVKGFGGGFPGATASEFGEPEMRAFVAHSRERAARLETALGELGDGCDRRVALLHYAPIPETLHGEPPGIFPFLGSYYLADAIDRAGADLALHGHAHRGSEWGTTPGGVPVRNVALPVLCRPYALFCFDGAGPGAPADLAAPHPALAARR
jgi:Icc-related predicted phosphoesterase